VGDVTSLLGVRVILDVLGNLVNEGKLGRRPTTEEREAKQQAEASVGE
jgi:hypothetical protein